MAEVMNHGKDTDMKEIVVQSGVRPPVEPSRCEGLYPWTLMKATDSFVVEGRAAAAAARGSFYRYQRIGKIPKNWKCVQRVEDDGTVRLWAVVGD
jgi:hypothetical protein